jgi:type IV secretion system protein VirB1
MQQVVRVESRGNPLALHVNGLAADRQPHPATTEEAVAAARHWVDLGYRVDLGLAQIDSANLPALHVTIDQVLGALVRFKLWVSTSPNRTYFITLPTPRSRQQAYFYL